MSKKRAVILISFCILIIGLFFYATEVSFQNPKNCVACHYIAPYYKKWETSTHKMVPCLKCHEYTPGQALAAQFMFLAGVETPRPLANVPDKNCLQDGCHDKRLIISKVTFTKKGVSFDHMLHLTEMKLGIKPHCISCHSDIVQGEHLKVSMNVCYLCHFKGVARDQAQSECMSCHSAPTKPVVYRGRTFSHEAALKAGYKCSTCHLEVTKGDGMTPQDKCYFCHVDREQKRSDIRLLHDKHVTEKQIDCLYCHRKIEHGKIKMVVKIPI